ncbi:MAG: hypothetical protein ACYTGH_17300 [Planctomycetota bacterium]|jgi:aromatic ring-opening dioxygenase LigB subunit
MRIAGIVCCLILGLVLSPHAFGEELKLDRMYYKLRVPDTCNVYEGQSLTSADDSTLIVFPDGVSSMMIEVTADKKMAPALFDGVKKLVKRKYSCNQELKSNFLYRQRGTGVCMIGKLNGTPAKIELGHFTFKDKGFIVICAYSKKSSGEFKRTRSKIMNTLRAK